MEQPVVDRNQVKGWGIDADPSNDPTHPIKRRHDGEHAGYSWERPPQQPATVEILQSNERPNLSAVFGTSTPPSGVSGGVRRYAFKYSESSYGHWLPLMLADRINAIEGNLHDLVHGRLPNPFRDRGWRAEWKYNRAALMLRILLMLVLVVAVVFAIVETVT